MAEITGVDKGALKTNEVNFRPVVGRELAGLFNKVVPEGSNAVKENWEFRGGEWKLVGSSDVRLVAAEPNNKGRCVVSYLKDGVLTQNAFGPKSEFGTNHRPSKDLEIQVKSISKKDGTLTIRRFYKATE